MTIFLDLPNTTGLYVCYCFDRTTSRWDDGEILEVSDVGERTVSVSAPGDEVGWSTEAHPDVRWAKVDVPRAPDFVPPRGRQFKVTLRKRTVATTTVTVEAVDENDAESNARTACKEGRIYWFPVRDGDIEICSVEKA